ncbi:unnamed protein product [Gulo gulo]|uniref:Uncharacterized protein n=1 Tax=Gulo gulo TaxID=48420 RepID=A0A9X9LZA1_GULGU|nr:unnamed protein product [Gulo gulo]
MSRLVSVASPASIRYLLHICNSDTRYIMMSQCCFIPGIGCVVLVLFFFSYC